jgi:hypothetical protein
VAVTFAFALLAGCETPIVVPPGAVTFHLADDATGIRATPDSVPAGVVYMILDTEGADPTLVEKGQPCGPLDDAKVEQLRTTGSSEGLCMISGFASGGQFGTVTRFDLTPGKYAFVSRSPGPGPDAGPFGPTEIAFLTVKP